MVTTNTKRGLPLKEKVFFRNEAMRVKIIRRNWNFLSDQNGTVCMRKWPAVTLCSQDFSVQLSSLRLSTEARHANLICTKPIIGKTEEKSFRLENSGPSVFSISQIQKRTTVSSTLFGTCPTPHLPCKQHRRTCTNATCSSQWKPSNITFLHLVYLHYVQTVRARGIIAVWHFVGCEIYVAMFAEPA